MSGKEQEHDPNVVIIFGEYSMEGKAGEEVTGHVLDFLSPRQKTLLDVAVKLGFKVDIKGRVEVVD